MNPLLLKYERGFLYSFNVLFLSAGNICFRIEVKHQSVAIILVSFPFFSTIRVVPDSGVSLYGCSTNPVGEKSPTGFFTCKKEKSEL